jgi:hypothetical protein
MRGFEGSHPMHDSWRITIDEARRSKEAKRWPAVLLWAGGAFLLAGLFTHQLLGIAIGLFALGAGGYWMQDIMHSVSRSP